MNRIVLAPTALAVLALALASSCRPPERPGEPPRTVAPAPAGASDSPQPWAVTGFRDDETWETIGPPPDVNPPFDNGDRARPQTGARHSSGTAGRRLLARGRP